MLLATAAGSPRARRCDRHATCTGTFNLAVDRAADRPYAWIWGMRISLLIDWLAHSLALPGFDSVAPGSFTLRATSISRISQMASIPSLLVACQSIPFAQLLILCPLRPEIILAH